MAGDDNLPEQRHGFLARLSAVETIVAAIIALVALAGLMLVGKGFYMKVRTEVSFAHHDGLEAHNAQINSF